MLNKSLFGLLLSAGMAGVAVAAQFKTNASLSESMLNPDNGVGRELFLLDAVQSGELKAGDLYLGGYLDPGFKYLYHQQPGEPSTTKTEITIPEVNLGTASTLTKHVLAFVKMGASDLGQSNADNLEVSDAYVLLHQRVNVSDALFGFVGKKSIDFGRFKNMVDVDASFGLPNLAEIYFKASGNVAGAGIRANGFTGVVSVMNGGSAGTNLYTSSGSNINNFALNAAYETTYGGAQWRVGAGYLDGSISNFKRVGGDSNSAVDLNAEVDQQHVAVLAEYDTTLNKTELTGNRAQALTVGGEYKFELGAMPSALGVQYSVAKANFFVPADGSKTQSSYSITLRHQAFKNVWFGLELNRADNIVSLNHLDETSIRLLATAVF